MTFQPFRKLKKKVLQTSFAAEYNKRGVKLILIFFIQELEKHLSNID